MTHQSNEDWLNNLQSQDQNDLKALQQQLSEQAEKIEKLERENRVYVDATDRFFGIPQHLSAYHRARALEKAGKMSLEASALDLQAEDLGYRTAARALYALGKMKSSSQALPDEFSVVPDEFISHKVSATKAQSLWKKLLPVLNDLWNDDSLDEQDLNDFKERVSENSGNFDEFANYILDVRRRELKGEFAQEAQALTELMQQRLAPATNRLQLTAATHFETVAGLLPPAKQSHDVKFEETGATCLRYAPDPNAGMSDLATKQLNALSEEDQEIALSLGLI